MPLAATGHKFEFIHSISHAPFATESTALNIQDLLYDLRLAPFADKCMATGRVPKHAFVVTRMTRYEEPPQRLGHRHTYVLVKIQPHPSQPQPPWSHSYLKITEENRGHPWFVRLGIYRTAASSTTIVDGPGARDTVVGEELSWPPEDAPILFRVINLIIRVNIILSWDRFKPCRVFAAAMMDAVYDIFVDGSESENSPPFIAPNSSGMRYAARLASRACNSYRDTSYVDAGLA